MRISATISSVSLSALVATTLAVGADSSRTRISLTDRATERGAATLQLAPLSDQVVERPFDLPALRATARWIAPLALDYKITTLVRASGPDRVVAPLGSETIAFVAEDGTIENAEFLRSAETTVSWARIGSSIGIVIDPSADPDDQQVHLATDGHNVISRHWHGASRGSARIETLDVKQFEALAPDAWLNLPRYLGLDEASVSLRSIANARGRAQDRSLAQLVGSRRAGSMEVLVRQASIAGQLAAAEFKLGGKTVIRIEVSDFIRIGNEVIPSRARIERPGRVIQHFELLSGASALPEDELLVYPTLDCGTKVNDRVLNKTYAANESAGQIVLGTQIGPFATFGSDQETAAISRCGQ